MVCWYLLNKSNDHKNITNELTDYLENGCYFDKVTDIRIYGDNNITTLPKWPNLQKLVCKDCVSLCELPNYDKLDWIQLVLCPAIQSLPIWPNLIEAQIFECGICSVPSWPLVTDIICWGCPNLINISMMNNLIRLGCQFNHKQCNLPAFPKLSSINLYDLPLMTSLSAWPKATSIQCDDHMVSSEMPIIWPLLDDICVGDNHKSSKFYKTRNDLLIKLFMQKIITKWRSIMTRNSRNYHI